MCWLVVSLKLYRKRDELYVLFAEHLDFMNALDMPDIDFSAFRQVEHDYIGYQSLTDVPKALRYIEDNNTCLKVCFTR